MYTDPGSNPPIHPLLTSLITCAVFLPSVYARDIGKMTSIMNPALNLIETALAGKWGYLAVGSVAIFLLYAFITVIYRLYFSPLAGFPGPKIAAATGWYEFYFDVIKRGRYIYEIEKMHHKYGNNRNTTLYSPRV